MSAAPEPTPPARPASAAWRHAIIAALVALAGVGIALAMIPAPRSDAPAETPPVALGTAVDFALTPAGRPAFRLAELRGQVIVVYFGYASCPDVCPTALAAIAAGLQALTPAELARVTVVFVSLDPERDEPARLADYAAWFHPRIRGVTGTPSEVAAAAATFGVTYRKAWPKGARDYVIDHSAKGYIVAPDGRLAAELPHAAPATDLAAAVRRELPRGPATTPNP